MLHFWLWTFSTRSIDVTCVYEEKAQPYHTIFFPISLKHLDFRHPLSFFHRETKEDYKIIFFIRDESAQ